MSEPTPANDEQAFLDEEGSHWGTWRAKGPIFIDGVRAFNAGHDVPNGHVEKYHLEEQGLVERIGEDDEAGAEEAPAAPPQGEPIQGNATVVGSADDDEPIYDDLSRKQQ